MEFSCLYHAFQKWRQYLHSSACMCVLTDTAHIQAAWNGGANPFFPHCQNSRRILSKKHWWPDHEVREGSPAPALASSVLITLPHLSQPFIQYLTPGVKQRAAGLGGGQWQL